MHTVFARISNFHKIVFIAKGHHHEIFATIGVYLYCHSLSRHVLWYWSINDMYVYCTSASPAIWIMSVQHSLLTKSVHNYNAIAKPNIICFVQSPTINKVWIPIEMDAGHAYLIVFLRCHQVFRLLSTSAWCQRFMLRTLTLSWIEKITLRYL